MKLNGVAIRALIDTGSTENFISRHLATSLKLKLCPSNSTVTMASSSLSMGVEATCVASLILNNRSYIDMKFSVLSNLCTDVILGHPFLSVHRSLHVKFGGVEPDLEICAVSAMRMTAPRLFQNLTDDCHPVATKARRFNDSDSKFIDEEILRLLSGGIIEASSSPWRAQVLVASRSNGKRRLVVDFSRTINRFTLLDAYPLPRIDDLVNEIAKYRYFSVIDMSQAYYQIPIIPSERPYTAFQAGNKLFQFTRIPMGVTNGVAAFQRAINEFINMNNLKGIYAYLDDLTVCGQTKEDHDRNLFLKAADKYNLTLNKEKSKFS